MLVIRRIAPEIFWALTGANMQNGDKFCSLGSSGGRSPLSPPGSATDPAAVRRNKLLKKVTRVGRSGNIVVKLWLRYSIDRRAIRGRITRDFEEIKPDNSD